jgi:Trk-type K+ transport system membrane component
MRQRRLQHIGQPSESEQNLKLARKDAASALIVWIFLEGLSFLILPNFQLIQGANKLPIWLSITLPAGIVGAAMIGMSSWWVTWAQETIDRQDQNKQLYTTLAQALGWLGLMGVGLPMIVVGLELWLTMLRGPQG